MIERKRTISAITIHFATQDLYDIDGVKVMSKGDMKPPKVEWSSYLEEDGAVLAESVKRETVAVADLSDLSIADTVVDQLAKLGVRGYAAEVALATEKRDKQRVADEAVAREEFLEAEVEIQKSLVEDARR